jgi:hypothetical protein
MNFTVTDQLLIIYEKNWEYNEAVHLFLKKCKKVYDSSRKGIRLNILTEFGIYMKQVRLIKMCSNETYSKVWIGTCVWYIPYLE